jgi:hypothetical protein
MVLLRWGAGAVGAGSVPGISVVPGIGSGRCLRRRSLYVAGTSSGAQAVARGAARCASQVLVRGAQAVASLRIAGTGGVIRTGF